MDNKKIGSKIKKARIESSLSQGELAEKIGVTWEMISRYENGRSSAHKHLDKIASIFEKDISYFVGETGLYDLDSFEKLKSSIRDNDFKYSIAYQVHKAPLYESYSEIIEDKAENQILYDIPSWVVGKYSNIFVMRLRYITSMKLDINPNDVAIFSKSDYEAVEKLCLFNDMEGNLVIDEYINGVKNKFLGRLIYIEKRFVD